MTSYENTYNFNGISGVEKEGLLWASRKKDFKTQHP